MVYVYLADGFEEIEALTVVDILRRADITVQTVSMMRDLFVTGAHDIPIIADMLFEDITHEHCRMMILPGGGPGSQRLLKHEGLRTALIECAEAGGKLAAICAAPMVLAHAGLLDGKAATIYDGMQDELPKASYTKQNVVIDGNIITSRGPGTAMQFAIKLVDILAGEGTAAHVASALIYEF
ncbi:MAG: DJ-1/PfpI family protein [Clostridiales Family XIII bacterium]|jgi:4-methyl-5(b-hydroxyethyl)-thiazole monophosphate biosynthesis|nr:DJ-1/PfpI family protein [Clostridiales Family XIII bacterium]